LFRKQCAPSRAVWGSTPLSSAETRQSNRAYTQTRIFPQKKTRGSTPQPSTSARPSPEGSACRLISGNTGGMLLVSLRPHKSLQILPAPSTRRVSESFPGKKIRLGAGRALKATRTPEQGVWGSTPPSSSAPPLLVVVALRIGLRSQLSRFNSWRGDHVAHMPRSFTFVLTEQDRASEARDPGSTPGEGAIAAWGRSIPRAS